MIHAKKGYITRSGDISLVFFSWYSLKPIPMLSVGYATLCRIFVV